MKNVVCVVCYDLCAMCGLFCYICVDAVYKCVFCLCSGYPCWLVKKKCVPTLCISSRCQYTYYGRVSKTDYIPKTFI